MLLATVVTAGSITHILEPMLMTTDEALRKTPEKIEVIITIKKTAKVMPISKAANFPLSLTSSLNAIFNIPFMPSNLSLVVNKVSTTNSYVVTKGVQIIFYKYFCLISVCL